MQDTRVNETVKHSTWIAACLVLVLVYAFTAAHVWQCEGVDEIEYLGLAHSMVRGFGYTIYGQPHVLYPPLFPTLLAGIMSVFGVTAWRQMYMMNALLGVSGWILVGTWLRTKFGRTGRWAAWLFLFAYYPWSFPCRFLMSEPVFLPISFAALMLAWRILERNRGEKWEYVLFGLMCLLGGMSRAAAVSLNLALVLAGGTRWIVTRRRGGMIVALLALVLGVGFFAYWSIRADVVNPDAVESHWRWAKKYLGMSKETEGIIATGEEITEISISPVRRFLFLAVRYGQFVTSVVRHPDNFLPLGFMLFALFLTGMIIHWRRRPWSPLAWYCFVFLAMILKTTWLSNYHRFLLVLTPMVFLFLLQGAQWWGNQLAGTHGRQVYGLCGALGLWGLWLTLQPGTTGSSGSEGLYVVAARWAVAVVYCGMISTVVAAMLRRPLRFPSTARAMTTIAIVATIHSGFLIAQRYSMTLSNATLNHRRLTGVLECGLWISSNTSAQAAHVSSIPRLTSFLSDRIFEAETAAGDYILLMGDLHETPPFRKWEEDQLKRLVMELVAEGRAVKVFGVGEGGVYKVIGY